MTLSINLPEDFLEPEPRTLVVSGERKRLWAVELDLLAQLDCICRKHGIQYFCAGGTALGVARHKGFIPWDDDIDVILRREEYNRLCAVAPQEFVHPYFWQTNETDPGSARGHAQLRNSNTTAILKLETRDGQPLYDFNQGVFIDIFPYDNLPDDPEERRKFIDEMRGAKAAIAQVRHDRYFANELRRRLSPGTLLHGLGPAIREGWASLRGIDRMTVACRALEALAQKYSGVPTREMAPISFLPDCREVFPAHFFDEVEYLDFEFIKVPVLRHYREALTISYGNWEEHVIGESMHGGMIVDTERPYTDYLKK